MKLKKDVNKELNIFSIKLFISLKWKIKQNIIFLKNHFIFKLNQSVNDQSISLKNNKK